MGNTYKFNHQTVIPFAILHYKHSPIDNYVNATKNVLTTFHAFTLGISGISEAKKVVINVHATVNLVGACSSCNAASGVPLMLLLLIVLMFRKKPVWYRYKATPRNRTKMNRIGLE